MILVSSLAIAAVLAQPPVATPRPRGPIVTTPVRPEPGPPPPPNMTVMVPGSPSPPPPPLPEPSPPAKELALRLLERIKFFEREARRAIANQLQWSGRSDSCDPHNEECRRIAEEIGAREAAAEARALRDSFGRVLGAMFDRDMTPAQITEADRFLRGDAGRALMSSLFSINEQTLAALGPPSRLFESRREDFAEEFAQRTRHLPRATLPVPAGPPYPAPPRQVPPPPPPRPPGN